MTVRIGIDTGGTFTDLVGYDDDRQTFLLAKSPSTPDDPARSVEAVLRDPQIDARALATIVVATTVATNAMLQRRGSRVLFITTRGFEDVPFIGRIDKAELYNLQWKKPGPLIARSDCFGVDERIDHEGHVLSELIDAEFERLAAFITTRNRSGDQSAIAICLLFSYVNPVHEQRLRDFVQMRFPEMPVSISCEISPVWREFERSATTISDAFVKPTIRDYVNGVREALTAAGTDAPTSMLKSNGGHLGIDHAHEQPVQFLVSGLAGGIVAARTYAQIAEVDNVFSLDMGGTSADIGTIQNRSERYIAEFQIGFGLPVAIPSVDVATIGAGGGSIAWIDKGGLLQVGPHSAGAVPGPICYGQGGDQATTTDANLALGRLNPAFFLGGRVPLDPDRALPVLEQLGAALGAPEGERIETAAHAIVDTANENMANQIRLIAVDRGLDPREFVLIPFGGAGPVHGAACARLLGMTRMLIPPHPGLSSAFGALAANLRVDRSLTVIGRRDTIDLDALNTRFASLERDAVAELLADGFTGQSLVLRSVDMRYAGQNYEREVPLPAGPITPERLLTLEASFARQHDEFYGFALEGETVEYVTIRVTAVGSGETALAIQQPSATDPPREVARRPVSFRGVGAVETPIYRREDLPAGFTAHGPAIIEETDSTSVIHPSDSFTVRADGLIDVTIGQ